MVVERSLHDVILLFIILFVFLSTFKFSNQQSHNKALICTRKQTPEEFWSQKYNDTIVQMAHWSYSGKTKNPNKQNVTYI